MSYMGLLCLVALGGYALASLTSAMALGASWPFVHGRIQRLTPLARARLILGMRAAPCIAGAVAASVSVLAFLKYEPRDHVETPGAVLLMLAAWSLFIVGVSVWRLSRRGRQSAQFMAAVERLSTRVSLCDAPMPVFRVETSFPLVALAGCLRPRLVVARRVLDDVPADEMRMILRHEMAHARRWDNLPRTLLSVLPDALMFTPTGSGIVRCWQESAEEAADDLASVGGADGRRLLAGAILRVARMAAGRPTPDVPALTLIGDSVERRVRRLLEPPAAPGSAPWLAYPVACLFAALAAAAYAPTLSWVHAVTEWMVNALA